ncbi:hypothetical protein ACFWCA_03170 [Streptomyces phaeochromogenes]|uniref:hypothetical protein n=1 Tax=Streptomyces phaeochromogenes TaxID=1923 RepID=UPI00368C8A51
MLVGEWLTVRRRTRTGTARPSAPKAWGVPIVCTAYSADTSWRFATDYLGMAGTAEHAGMCGAAELVLFATAALWHETPGGAVEVIREYVGPISLLPVSRPAAFPRRRRCH